MKLALKELLRRPGQFVVAGGALTLLVLLMLFLGWLQRDVTVRTTEHSSYRWFDWDPPHRIQTQTIDPLLDQVAEYFATDRGS